MIRRAVALAALAVGLAACAPTGGPDVVTIPWNRTGVVDVSPPQRLDVVMTRSNTAAERGAPWAGLCADIGGWIRWEGDGTATCVDVDY